MVIGNLRIYCSLLLTCLALNLMEAQDECVLGVGITENETLIQVFQLNEAQKEELLNSSAELKYRNEVLTKQADKILEQNPQKTEEELILLAKKYNEIRDSLAHAQRLVDKRILKLFNERQYQRYLELCSEVMLQPYKVIPAKYQDSVSRN